jgi:hypothetical protein
MTDIIKEGENFLTHHGVLGMHWGQRKARPMSERQSARSATTTPIERIKQYAKHPTARQYLLGAGKTQADRAAYRRDLGKIAIATILASGAAKIAVNRIPKLSAYSIGVTQIANFAQLASYGTLATAGIAGVIDRHIPQK